MSHTTPLTLTMMTPLEAPETGWCEPCALPSVLIWHMAIEASALLLADKLTTLRLCVDCGTETWE